MRHILSFAAILSAMAGCAASPTISTGSLGQAQYMIAAPGTWNGDLLLLAHGYRTTEAPLRATFDPAESPFKELLRDGWIVAETSYRRNGMIIRDACDDVQQLRQHVADRFGRPKRTFLIGWSMGGAVAVMLAETHGGDYQGVLAIGAALGLQDAVDPYRMTYQPQTPVLFVSNQNEMKDPTDYAARAAGAAQPTAAWVVKRDGHCNVSGAEMLVALDALATCGRTGKLEREKDVTLPLPARPSVATFRGGRAYAKVTKVSGDFGNIIAPYVPSDLERLGIAPGSRFVVGMGDKSFPILYGRQYGDVARGKWVAFFSANGEMVLGRSSANAASQLGCVAGDEIYISRSEPDK